MMKRFSTVFFLVFFIQGSSIVAGSCRFETITKQGASYQQKFYDGYLQQALHGWETYAQATHCPLSQAYYMNDLFWVMLYKKSHDEDIRKLKTTFEAVAKDIEGTHSPRVQEVSQEKAFARAWAYILRAQWAGMNRKWTKLPGLLKKGLYWLNEAEQIGKPRPEILYYRGLALYLLDQESFLFKLLGFFVGLPKGDREQGLTLIKKAVQKPSLLQEDMILVLSALFLNEKKFSYALEEILRLRRMHPRNPVYHFWEGLFYERSVYEYERALDVYRSIFAIAHSGLDERYDASVKLIARYRVGYMYAKLYDFHKAEEWFNPILQKKPKTPPWVYPKTCLVLGDLYRNRGKIDRAKFFYRKVLAFPSPELYRKRAKHNLKSKLSPPAPDALRYINLRSELQSGKEEVCQKAFIQRFSDWQWRMISRFECLKVQSPQKLPEAFRSLSWERFSWGTFIPYRIFQIMGQYYEEQRMYDKAKKMYMKISQKEDSPDEFRLFSEFKIQMLQAGKNSLRGAIAH